MSRSTPLYILITPEDHERLKDAAKAGKSSMSSLIYVAASTLTKGFTDFSALSEDSLEKVRWPAKYLAREGKLGDMST
jgi:hypothetical protein